MSTWFIRFLILIVACLAIAHAYPSSMSKHKWLQEHIGYRPHTTFEISPDSLENDLADSDGLPTWLYRSRKFCCAPPL